MDYHFSYKRNISKIVIFTLLIFLLISCNTSTTSPNIPATNGNMPTPSPLVTNTDATVSPNTPATNTNALAPLGEKAFDVSGILHIQSSIDCEPSPGSGLGLLTLSSNQFEYDSHEIQQISTYLDNSDSTPIPSVLKLVQGATVTPSSIGSQFNGCIGSLDLTNIGTTAVLLSDMTMRLTTDSTPNNYQYNLLNVCSIEGTHISDFSNRYTCSPGAGGMGSFTCKFLFHPEKANTIFQCPLIYQGIPSQDGTLPGATNPSIEPGNVIHIIIFIESPSPAGGQVYTAIPSLTLSTGNRQTTVELPLLAGSFAFAQDTQFSCYNLQGDTFVSQKVYAGISGVTNKVRCI